MTRRVLAVTAALIVLPQLVIPRAPAAPGLAGVVATIRDAGGHYLYGAATLKAADCSGIVSVAQSLATGQPIRRLGDTHTLMAGRWPHAIRGATETDRFVIGGNSSHMVARVEGVNLEARRSGEPFRIGPDARSPFDFPQQWHIDERVLVA